MELDIQNQELVKCVVVGDTGVGKTRLVCARACGTKYTLHQLMQTHHSTVWAIDNYRRDLEVLKLSCCEVDGVSVSLRLWDTFGYHDKDRRFAYSKADVVLLCFSTVRPMSLKNVAHIWYPEIKKSCPNTPIVLVGCQVDLRYLYKDEEFNAMDKGPFFQTIRERDIILPEAGRKVANDIGADYFETSVFTSYGLNEVFENVSRTALIERSKMRFWNPQLKRVLPLVIQAPPLPPPKKAQKLNILQSDYTADFEKLLDDQEYCNIVFIADGEHILAHKIVLMCASAVFYDLFLTNLQRRNFNENHNRNSALTLVSDQDILIQTMDDIGYDTVVDKTDSCSLHPAFTSAFTLPTRDLPWTRLPNNKSLQMAVMLNPEITPDVFRIILQFMYTGHAVICRNMCDKVRHVADLLGLPELIAIITDLENGEGLFMLPDEDFLQRRSEKFRDLLLRQGLFSDILFHCEDGEVMTHKALLMTRCDWMLALFTDNFRESSQHVIPLPGMSKQTFQCVLDFLYTDQCPDVTTVDVTELLEVANRFCLLRLLSLLEQCIIEKLTRVEENGEEIVEEVLFLLEPAQLYNAFQLATWCLCYLSNNYSKAYKLHFKDLKSLCQENQEYVSENRWPPVWYLKEQDMYEKLVRERSKQKLLTIRRRQRNGSGCLCLSSRRWKKVNQEDCWEV